MRDREWKSSLSRSWSISLMSSNGRFRNRLMVFDGELRGEMEPQAFVRRERVELA
jgi:hypothetical protein